MSPSTDLARRVPGWVVLAVLGVLGACATLDMPTPIEHVRTQNQMAPSYEYRPPPSMDAGVPDVGDMDAGMPDARPPEAGVFDAMGADAMGADAAGDATATVPDVGHGTAP